MEYFKVYSLIAAFLAVSSRAHPMSNDNLLVSDVDPGQNEIDDTIGDIKADILTDIVIKEDSKLVLRKFLENELDKMTKSGKMAKGNIDGKLAHERAIQSIKEMLTALSIVVPDEIFVPEDNVVDSNIVNKVFSSIETGKGSINEPAGTDHFPLFRENFDLQRESLFIPRRQIQDRPTFVNPIFENRQPMFDPTTGRTEAQTEPELETEPELAAEIDVEPELSFGGGPSEFLSMDSITSDLGELGSSGLSRNEEELLNRFVSFV